jgi:hypothetical protein
VTQIPLPIHTFYLFFSNTLCFSSDGFFGSLKNKIKSFQARSKYAKYKQSYLLIQNICSHNLLLFKVYRLLKVQMYFPQDEFSYKQKGNLSDKE